MSDLTVDSLKKEILVVVNQRSAVLPGTGSRPPEKAHKMNVIGRQYSPGELERNLGRNFTAQERALASRAWDELKSNGYIEPTFDDIAEPEAWVLITDAGRAYLGRDLKDQIDVA